MKKRYFFLLPIIFIQFGCEDDNIPQLPTNENLLFVNSYELDINASPGINNFPLFDISNVEYDKVFIAVSTEPLKVVDNQVQNIDAIVWHWNSGMDAITQIAFSDGELDNPTLAGNESLCCNNDIYYWAAWAWNASGQYIEASTTNYTFTILDNAKPNIIIENTVLIEESGGDGYIQKQETITLKFFVKNIGNATARNVQGTFSHPLISSMPSLLNFGTILPDAISDNELVFVVPTIPNLDLQLNVDFLYNNNLTKDTIVIQPVTLLPCIEQIYLEWTNRNLDNMDDFNVDADIYAKVYGNNNLFVQTPVIYNIGNDELPVSWVYSPCGQYYLSETFDFEFWDYDTAGGDDYIGSINVKFGDWAEQKSFPLDTTIQNNEVSVRFEIDWK